MAEIKCPRCKDVVPKAPICSKCGFDIKGYYHSQRRTQVSAIKCPKCKGMVPRKAICEKCGFDIKEYYTKLKAQQASDSKTPSKPAAPVKRKNKAISVSVAAVLVLLLIGSLAAFLTLRGNKAIPAKEAYLGCFTDQGNPAGLDGRDMSGAWMENGDLTIEKCVSECITKGFSYAGVQYSSHCFCDNDYGASGISDNCNMPCSGDGTEICGGPWANSVYKAVPLLAASSRSVAIDLNGNAATEEKEAPKAESVVSWDDPEGDTYPFESMNRPFMDIVGVRATGKDGYLVLEMMLDRDLEYYFTVKDSNGFLLGYTPVDFYIDTDNNPDSGSAPMRVDSESGETRGYSHNVEVLTGFLSRQEGTDNPAREHGNLKISPDRQGNIIRGDAIYWVEEGTYSDSWDRMRKEPDEFGSGFDKLVSISGNILTIRVPYELLGVERGQVIRLCFKEEGQDGADKDKFSSNKVLELN